VDLDPGTNVGPYQIVAPIGAGAMGCVYRARDPRLARDVAIKIIAARFSRDEDAVRRFTLEARAAAALAHPSILAVHDVGVHEGTPYIVSELLTGGTLRERLTDARPHALDIRKASAYAVQLAGGLAAAHDKGIFHRDLKPENVFVTRDGQIKILDFGVAKLAPVAGALVAAAEAPTSVDTEPGLFFGTIGYCAPEQLHGQPVDHRADIFAFGIILYEMLTGRSPFPGQTPADALSAVLERDPEQVPGAGTRVPDAFTKIIERCLEKDPAARFQSTRDLGSLSTRS
jgi:serine/threonine protein kinase